MSDFARFLPLSARVRDDESGVSSDRRVQLAAVVDAAAVLLGPRADTGAAGAHSGPDAVTGVDAADQDSSARTFLGDARLHREARQPGAEASVALRTLAASIRGGRRRSIRSLAHGVRALLLLAERTGGTVTLAPEISGSVALYAATAAPLERRAVVTGHALHATDAGWQFGRGPALEGPALQIVAFLLGVSEIPPIPAAPPEPPQRPGQVPRAE
jgi:hypothetical protein